MITRLMKMKRANKRTSKRTNGGQTKGKQRATNKNDKNDKNNIKENIKRKNPTLEEIQNYITEKNLKVNAKQFYDYFTEGNWIDSKGSKVKNWKQKLLTWDKFNISPVFKNNNSEKVTNLNNYTKREYTENDFNKFYNNGG